MADDDTIKPGEGDDTLQGDGADTTAAAGDDTTVAGEGTDSIAPGADDTVTDVQSDTTAGDLAPDPVVSTPRATVPLEPDDIERDFDAAIQSLDADEMKSDSEKAAARAQLRAQKADYRDRRERKQRESAQDEASEEDRIRNTEAKTHGVSRQVIDNTWAQACRESQKTLGRHSHDAAMILYKQKIDALKAAAKKPAAKPKAEATPVMGKGQVLPRGVGNVPPQPKEKDARTVEERMIAGDKELSKDFAGIYDEIFG